jgi:hypothetical protein
MMFCFMIKNLSTKLPRLNQPVDRMEEVGRIYSVRIKESGKSNAPTGRLIPALPAADTPYRAFFFLNSLGVNPVCFLKTVLKEDFELKPTSYRTSSTVIFLSAGLVNSRFASPIR